MELFNFDESFISRVPKKPEPDGELKNFNTSKETGFGDIPTKSSSQNKKKAGNISGMNNSSNNQNSNMSQYDSSNIRRF